MIKLFQNVRSNYQVASRSEQDVNNNLYWANKVLWLQGQSDEVHVQIEVRYIQTGRRYGKNAHNLYWYGRIYSLCLRSIFVLIFCMIKTGLSLADWVSLNITNQIRISTETERCPYVVSDYASNDYFCWREPDKNISVSRTFSLDGNY